MKERMQKTLAEVKGCPQRDRTESEGYVGVQTYNQRKVEHGRLCYIDGFIHRMVSKIGTAVCGTARTVV